MNELMKVKGKLKKIHLDNSQYRKCKSCLNFPMKKMRGKVRGDELGGGAANGDVREESEEVEEVVRL